MTDDVVASIDALLAEQELCGCGCGKRITAASPSPFFASQECQELWAARRAKSLPDDDGEAEFLAQIGGLVTNPPPQQRAVLDAAEIERMIALLSPPRPAPESRREPVSEQPRPGHQLVLFVGGPWDDDIRAMPVPLDRWWNVAAAYRFEPAMFTIGAGDMPAPVINDTVTYTRTTLIAPSGDRFDVYSAPGVADDRRYNAATRAIRRGWRP